MPTHDISDDIQVHYGEDPNLVGVVDRRNGNILVMTKEEAVDLGNFLAFINVIVVEGTVD